MSAWNPNQLPHVYLVQEDGTVESIWYPELDLGLIDLTRLTGERPVVERASTVEPNPDTGRWDVRLRDGTFVGTFPSRLEAVYREVQFLTERLSHGESICCPESRQSAPKKD